MDKIEVSLKKESAHRSLFRNQEPGKISEPPPERKFSAKRKGRFRGSRVHQIDKKQGQDLSDGDDTVYKPGAGAEAVDGEPDDRDKGDYDNDTPEEAEDAATEEYEDPLEQVPTFLTGIPMDKIGKRPPLCYLLTKEGKCTFAYCKYSHHPSDIKAYLDLDKH